MIHPLTRLIIVLCISTLALVYNNLIILAWLLLACLLLLSGSKNLDYIKLGKFLRFFVPLLISIFIIQIIFNRKGEVLLDFGLFSVTYQGLHTAISVSLRLLILFLAGVWLWGLSHRDFNQAFRAVGLPDALAVMISLTLRFLPMLIDKIRQSTTQLKLRGINMRSLRFRQRLQLYLKLLVPILGWTMKDLRYQAIALDLRGFRNGQKRSFYKRRKLSIMDWMLILIALVCLWLPRILWQN